MPSRSRIQVLVEGKSGAAQVAGLVAPRKNGQLLGNVEAAEAAAVKKFNLTEEQRKRRVVQERG
jgi:hypothetical protein